MSKKPKPAPKSPKRKKRPPSVMAKAWATRHAKMLLTPAAEPTGVKMPPPNKASQSATLRLKPMQGNPIPASNGSARKTRRFDAEVIAGPAEVSKLDVLTEQLLATAKSNNRAEARPRFRHELAEMIHGEHYAGVEEGIAYNKSQTSEAVLCSLVSTFRIAQRLDSQRYAPQIIGPVTMQVVVELLESLGYSANGRNQAATPAIR